MLGPHTLLAVGDGSSSSGASVIEFDAHWKSYSWGKSLPPAISPSSKNTTTNTPRDGGVSAGAGATGGGSGVVGLDDVCSLIITPSSSSTSTISDFLVTGMSATGMVGSWTMPGGSSKKSTAAKCIATGSHAGYAVRAAIPIPHISLGNNENVQCFVALLQSRDSVIGETAVAVATLTPSGGLTVGEPVPVPVPVTAIGSMAPSLFSHEKPTTAQDTTTTTAGDEAVPNSKYHHNQDKILLGCGNGTVRVWNLRTGVCSPPVDVCCGSAITSFATTRVTSTSTTTLSDARSVGTEAVICTSIQGDCVVLETAALMKLMELCSS